jgi:hypothetical protein
MLRQASARCFRVAARAQEHGVYEPGLDRHEWESELRALEDQLAEHPAESLPELDALVGRMLEETGYALGDTVARIGNEPEIVAEFLAAREITEAVERDSDDISPGDVAAAINGYRAVFDHVVTTRSSADADLDAAELEE